MQKISRIITSFLLVLFALNIAPALIKSIKLQYSAMLEPHTKVAVINFNEPIEHSSSYVKLLKQQFEDQEVKAILLFMNCPGGTAGASQAIYREISELKKVHLKPVVAFVENLCASGGYYIASAADHIIATPSAFVGSIGVYIPQPQLKAFLEQFKIQYNFIQTGTYKTTGNLFTDLTPDQRKLLQSLTDDTYQQFIYDISQSRPHLTLDTASLWADGKIFTGRQALHLGLVDELGSQSTAEHAIRKKAPIEGEIEWVKTTPKRSFLKELLNDDTKDNDESYMSTLVKAFSTHAEKSFCAHT